MLRLLYTNNAPKLQLLSPNLHDFWFLGCANVIIARTFSSTVRNHNQLKKIAFTVSYLINSCGLSPEAANSAAKKVQYLSSKGPDSVLALFKTFGFSDSQITKTVKSCPRLLIFDSQKILCPKLKFFNSIGFSGPDLPKFVSSIPNILERSLRNHIIPIHKFLKSALLFDDDKVVKAMRNQSRTLLYDVKEIIAPNLLFLREIGMPQSVIQYLFLCRSHVLCYKVDKFRGKVKELMEMGICPMKTNFVVALGATMVFSESRWQHKIEAYGRCGWSKDEIMSAFKLHPQFMTYSEKKIIDTMDFLLHVMNMKRSSIAASPYLCSFSLKKRIIPRGLVIKILMSKGLLEIDTSFYTVLHKTDERFLKEYVERHREQIPNLVDVFEGRISPEQLGFHYGH